MFCPFFFCKRRFCFCCGASCWSCRVGHFVRRCWAWGMPLPCAALWLHEHTLYFGMTSASFSTQSGLIWEEARLWRGKLLWITCPEWHWCHLHGFHGRSSREYPIGEAEGCCAGETDALLPLWAAAESIQTRLCLSLTAGCVFYAGNACGSAEHAHLEGKSVGAVCWMHKML